MSEELLNENIMCEICLDDKVEFWKCSCCNKLVCCDCKVKLPIKDLSFSCPYCRFKHIVIIPNYIKDNTCRGIINCFLYSLGLNNNKTLWTDGKTLRSKNLIIGMTTIDGWKNFGDYTKYNLGSRGCPTTIHIRKCKEQAQICLFKNIIFHKNMTSWVELMNNGDIQFG
tara:strand:+ start:3241 stop:3747 length:507 start_codon:yes stop_codon:yes gene_type:complete